MVSAQSQACPSCRQEFESVEGWSQCPRCLLPWRRVAGQFRILQEIGQGSSGRLFRVEDCQSKQHFALKVLHPELFQHREAAIRFRREIRVTRKLSQHSRHIVQLSSFGQDEHFGHYFVMELLEGETLRDFLSHSASIAYSCLFELLGQLCDVVQRIHSEGVLHRDLCPKNIFVVKEQDGSPFVKLLDFGVAKALEGTLHSQLTHGAIGTPGYMSPEQWRGETVDAKTDQYALGILAYEMLTGRLPFEVGGGSYLSMMQLMHKHMEEDPPSLRMVRPELELPQELDRVVQKALCKDPAMRYPSVYDFWCALAPFSSLERSLTMGSTLVGNSHETLL